MSNNSNNSNEKFCTKCGRKFLAVGREVICPACKQAAAEESKKAAVLKAKRASWNGELVPVRISGRASTIIRKFGEANNLPFAESLDELLKSTPFFQTSGKAWEDITPYKSQRRDKHATETESTPQDATNKPQDEQEVPQEVKTAQAAKTTSKTTTSKATSTTAGSKAATATKRGGKKAC